MATPGPSTSSTRRSRTRSPTRWKPPIVAAICWPSAGSLWTHGPPILQPLCVR